MPSNVADRPMVRAASTRGRDDATASMPRSWHRVVDAALRWRYLLLALLAVGIWAGFYSLPSDDWSLWVYFGRTVTGQVGGSVSHEFFTGGLTRALHMYVDMPRTQIGPVALWAAVPFSPLPILVAARTYALLMMIAGVAVVRLCDRAFPAERLDRRRQTTVLIGGAILLGIWSVLAVKWLHLDDVLAIGLLVAAVRAVRNGRWMASGFLLATAVSAKPWAIVALPVIMALPREKWAKAFLALIGTGLAWWLPFIVAAPSTVGALGGVVVPLQPSTVWRLLGLTGVWAPHWLRSVQLGVALLTCFGAIRRDRLSAVILVGLWCRVILDPGVYSYYLAGPVAGALLFDLSRDRRWPAFTAASAGVALAGMYLPWPTLAAAVRLAGGVAIMLAAIAPELLETIRSRGSGWRRAGEISGQAA